MSLVEGFGHVLANMTVRYNMDLLLLIEDMDFEEMVLSCYPVLGYCDLNASGVTLLIQGSLYIGISAVEL